MKFLKITILLFLSYNLISTNIFAEDPKKKDESYIYSGLKFRSIGPALMSGRISDIVIHPENENIWYVTAGSGGVWKTENSGTTWNPIFDNQQSYSIGCITIDPQNPNILWVGTGENVGGRHVGYGDGIYKSEDGGKTWKNMGLKTSEHISKIIVHPKKSNIIWVASQGPLWSKGGERGVFKSIDGGATWTQKLGDEEWIGATDLIIDPRNHKLLYAATWQRHRTVAGYLGGGPGTAIYKSQDGGNNWEKITNGLPKSNMGKIGLTIAPQNPDIIYAAIELDRRKGGVFKSTNKGADWEKMSDAVSGGTGPHYYQEIFASPHNFNEIYLVDNYMQVSYDGGRTFTRMNEQEKHVDNHAIAFKKSDPNYILVGCDGGLYESFDNTKNWKFVDNLPITQFYKIAVDDSKPFYYVYGGTQDNNTQGAPSRTENIHGVRNSDWFVVLGGDGHQPATEPGNPNIVYAQWQRGNLNRHDRITGENINIKPQPEIEEETERFNWDAPVLISPHNPKRLYFASQRVWKSEDRGDSWQTISNDLTQNIKRIQTTFYGKKQKWDNPWDMYAMSNYSTITSLSESPIKEGLIYIGTDDGIIQVTEDGGSKWRKVNFDKIKGLPKTAFVNDIKADLHNENIVYAAFDNHKYGDFSPYLFKSKDKGKTWKSISNNIPDRTLLWRIVQDHKNPDLLFLGTEFGIYFTNQKNHKWIKLKSGMPNIAVRDLAIQKRENDLVAGTFGRGIYILDDYSSLRYNNIQETKEAKIFTPRESYWYIQKRVLGGRKKASQGDNYFTADNPPFGVEFTYYITNKYLSKKDQRMKKEKELEKNEREVQVPEWSQLDKENQEIKPNIWLFIYSKENKIIKKIKAKNKKGFNRVNWDLTSESQTTISSENREKNASGHMIAPGTYYAELFKQIEGDFKSITDKIEFKIKPIRKKHLDGSDYNIVVDFWENIHKIWNETEDLSNSIKYEKENIEIMLKSYKRANKIDKEINEKLINIRINLLDLEQKMNGSKSRSSIGEQDEKHTIWKYLWSASGSSRSTYGPTETHKKSLTNAKTILINLNSELQKIKKQREVLMIKLEEMGAPNIKSNN